MIVVIGASAGGVTATLRLASALPPRFPAPIVVVQHIGAQPSRLSELLNARGPNVAVNAAEGVVPVAGTIYVAPPDHHVLLRNGCLRLTKSAKENHARPAIDPLFRSAAIEYGPQAIGVILTGMLDDGAAGLRAIKECGGIAVVQDPDDAHEPSMPRSAMAATEVDHVVEIDALAGLLTDLVHQHQRQRQRHEGSMKEPPLRLIREQAAGDSGNALEFLKDIGKPSTFSCPDCGGVMFELDDKRPLRFRCHTGHAYSMLSLAARQEEIADQALWSALRAMQEKEAGLRRMAERLRPGLGQREQVLQEAELLAEATRTLRGFTARLPVDGVPSSPLVDLNPDEEVDPEGGDSDA